MGDLHISNEALASQSPERAGFHAYLYARTIEDPVERAEYLQSLWRNETNGVLTAPENSDNYETRSRHTAFALARVEAAGLLADLELRGIIPGNDLAETPEDNQDLLRERYDAVVNEFADANVRSAMIYMQLGLVDKWGKKVNPEDYNRDEKDSTLQSRKDSYMAALEIANNYAPRVNAETLPAVLRALGISNPERKISRMFRTRGLGDTFDGFYQMVCQMIGQKPNMRIEQWQLGQELQDLLPNDPNNAGYLYSDHGFGRVLNAIMNSWWTSFRPAGSVNVSKPERIAMETMGFLAHSTWASAVLAGRVIVDGNNNRLTKANFVEFQRMLFDYYNKKANGFDGQMSAYSEAVKDLVIFINGWLGLARR